jgi:hypothetical protein
MLEQQHARDEAHKATVEETVDEEDLKPCGPHRGRAVVPTWQRGIRRWQR